MAYTAPAIRVTDSMWKKNLIFVTKNQILHGHLDHRRADVLEIAGDIVRLRKSTGTHSQNDLCR